MCNPALIPAAILKHSHATALEEALDEWVILKETDEPREKCLCGHDIRACFFIVNKITNKQLGPIGNECIKRFAGGRKELLTMHCDPCNKDIAIGRFMAHLGTPRHRQMESTHPCATCPKRVPFGTVKCSRCATRPCMSPGCRKRVPEDDSALCPKCTKKMKRGM